MKKRNQKKSVCAITNLWPCIEDMKKDLFIDLDSQQITNLNTGKVLSQVKNRASKKVKICYLKINFKSKKKRHNFRVHRLFFYWKHGYLPKVVDHIDRNSLNNKIENLRDLSQSNNLRNSNKQNRKNFTSKYKGVSREGNKWLARIRDIYAKKDIRIGLFNSEDEAGQAYNDKIRELGLEKISVLNDTPQERARKNNQFDPLPEEMNHIKVLFQDIEPLVDLK